MNDEPASFNSRVPPTTLLQGRVILVTGAANGIGQAAVKAMAAHGATTILLAAGLYVVAHLGNAWYRRLKS